jgi:ATP/maltotriose-dependent transcriptional regulator MalT
LTPFFPQGIVPNLDPKTTAMFLTFQPGALDKNDKENITKREREVLMLMAQGNINKEIAHLLHISTDTVKQHIKNIYRKLGAGNKIEALNKTGMLTMAYASVNRN